MDVCQLEKLKSICNRENVTVEILKPPRYIMPFILDGEEVILIRKEGTMPEPFTPLIRVKEDNTEEEFDLTGSPLHTSLDDSLINNPMIQGQNINEYYNHSPVPVNQALRIINHFTQLSNPTHKERELPVWVLCDAKDPNHTVLMMLWRRDGGWVTRGAAVLPSTPLLLQNPSLDIMLREHLKVSAAEKSDVSYKTMGCYNLSRNEASVMMTDELGDIGSSLKMHLSWTRPHTHFNFPPYDAVSRLEMNVGVGSEGSLLWQDIERLQEIQSLMQSSLSVERENQLLMSMATMNLTVMSSSVRSQVHSYITYGKLPPSLSSDKPPGVPKIGVNHVLHIYEEAVAGLRRDTDVTEVLWNILKGCSDLVELNSCFKMIIREAASGRFIPKIQLDNKTSLAKIIKGAKDILQTMSLKLRGDEALRLLFELGHLKLQRDYKYMLQRLELKFPECYDIASGLNKTTMATEEQRGRAIENLIAVHSIIEALIVLQSQLSLDDASMALLAESALPHLSSSAVHFAKTYSWSNCVGSSTDKMSLSLPILNKISIPLVKGCNPESWSFSLSTSKPERKMLTIFHGNNDVIFPPEISEKGDIAVGSNTKENLIVKFTMFSDHLFLKK